MRFLLKNTFKTRSICPPKGIKIISHTIPLLRYLDRLRNDDLSNCQFLVIGKWLMPTVCRFVFFIKNQGIVQGCREEIRGRIWTVKILYRSEFSFDYQKLFHNALLMLYIDIHLTIYIIFLNYFYIFIHLSDNSILILQSSITYRYRLGFNSSFFSSFYGSHVTTLNRILIISP